MARRADCLIEPSPTEGEDYSKESLLDECEKEQSEVLDGFKARQDAEQDRLVNTIDSEYWFAVCFLNREQKDRFLEALGLDGLGDKYLDGLEVAKRMKVPLPVAPMASRKKPIDRKLAGLVRGTGEDAREE